MTVLHRKDGTHTSATLFAGYVTSDVLFLAYVPWMQKFIPTENKQHSSMKHKCVNNEKK